MKTSPFKSVLALVLAGVQIYAASFETARTNLPGWTVTWEGQVEFLAPQQAPVPVCPNQFLNFGDALRTLALSRAVVRLQDWSDLRLKDRTRLEIVRQRVPVSSPGLKLYEGQIYFSSRAAPGAIPVETPHARGVPQGTEFLVRVEAGQTEVTMFDGEVELSNGFDTKRVRGGQQGIAVPGQPIQIRPILEARNLVQWWIFYPAVLDPGELGLSPAEEAALTESLAAYRRGNLLGALHKFPSYPAPAEPLGDAQREYLAALLLAVGAIDQAEALLAKVDSHAPPGRALRTMILAVTAGQGTEGTKGTEGTGGLLPILHNTPELLALSYAHQATNNLKLALASARAATARSPGFGFAWARLAELEFSFGRIRAAREAVERALELSPENAQNYYAPPIRTAIDEPYCRWSLYGYQTVEVAPALRLTAGLAYEHLEYPANFRFPPLSDERRSRDALLPKAAVQWDLHANVRLRGMYAQSLGGLSYDESVRLEPTQLAGFAQAFRSVISEAEVGSVIAPRYELGGLALDTKFHSSTFLSLQAHWIVSDVGQSIGIFRSSGGLAPPPQATPSTTAEDLRYEEQSLSVSADQLLGRAWSLGAGYQFTRSRLRWTYPEIPAEFPLSPDRTEEALLHRLTLRLQYQHPSGLFARAESTGLIQANEGYGQSIYSAPRPGDAVYQLDLFAGWRFLRRRGEITFGCLNVTAQDYRLNSLTPYADLPRERVWLGRVRFSF